MIRIILICFLNVCFFGFSQENLVRDSSFENCRPCRSSVVTNWRKYPLKKWTLPNNSTSDYFYNNGQNGSVPNNFNGYQNAHSGKGYAGIGVRKNWREYLQTKLEESLVKDSVYSIRFFVSLAERSRYSVSCLGAYLSVEEIRFNSYEKLNVTPVIHESAHIIDTAKWVEVSGTYKAKGGERFLIIGSFGEGKKSFRKTKFNYSKKGMDKWAYYYVDDASIGLRKFENSNNDLPIDVIHHDLQDKLFVLPSVSFNTNESTLLPSVFSSLDSLVNELKISEQIKVSIEGHTDNVGSSDSNMILSYNRALAVKNYLLLKGIKSERMKVEGFGDAVPISDNSSENGRKKNRRVEVKFL